MYSGIAEQIKLALLYFDKVALAPSVYLEDEKVRELVKQLKDYVVFQTGEPYLIKGVMVQPDGSLSYIDTKFDIDYIGHTIDSLCKKSGVDLTSPLHSSDLERLTNEIKGIKDTALQKVIWSVVIALCISIGGNFLTDEIKDIIHSSGTQRYQQSNVMKVVTATNLNIREYPMRQSKCIAVMHRGDHVNIVEKRGDWFLVLWRKQDSDTMIQGWASRRYLK